MSDAVLTHLAVGTSLATIVITSISSVRTHHQKEVCVGISSPLAAGIVLERLWGPKPLQGIKGPVLQTIIGIFAILVAVQMLFALAPKPSRTLPDRGTLLVTGGVFGWASAIFGIGGGSLVVPYLSWCNVRMQEAVGTSSACGFPIAVSGALSYAILGWGDVALPEYSTGFVYWPALVGITGTSVVLPGSVQNWRTSCLR